MKKTLLVALGLLFVLSPLAADVNRIVLRVNDHILTLYDYKDRYNHPIASPAGGRHAGGSKSRDHVDSRREDLS